MRKRTTGWFALLGLALGTLVWVLVDGWGSDADSAPQFADLRSDDLDVLQKAAAALRQNPTLTALPALRSARSQLQERLVKAAKYDLSQLASSRSVNEVFRVTDLRGLAGRQHLQAVLNDVNRVIWEIDGGAARDAAEQEEIAAQLELERYHRAADEGAPEPETGAKRPGMEPAEKSPPTAQEP